MIVQFFIPSLAPVNCSLLNHMHLRPVDGCAFRSTLGRRLHVNSGVSIVQTMVVVHNVSGIECHDEYEELCSVRPHSEIRPNAPLHKRIRRQITVVPGAQGADLPAKRARYSLTLKDDSASPGAVLAAAPGASLPNAAAAAAADCGASAAKTCERAADDAAAACRRGYHQNA
jgi:hypothetical protein